MQTRYSAICVHVEDGDTFTTSNSAWIRLANVCAPEKGQPDFEKARNILAGLVFEKSLFYEPVGKSYDRVVAEVWVDNVYVNGYMQSQGYTCP